MGCSERIRVDGKIIERDCHSKGKPQADGPTSGPGTELKAILKDWLGIEATLGCSCNAMARQMDSMGPEWCETVGMSVILDAMRKEHATRKNKNKNAKRKAKKTIWLPWSDIGARQLVLLACRRARAKGMR
jgi:hypothetical protein